MKNRTYTKDDCILAMQEVIQVFVYKRQGYLHQSRSLQKIKKILEKLNTIRLRAAVNLLKRIRKNNRDLKFRVVFTKRSTQKKRVMYAKFNYDELLVGGKAPYNFEQKRLMPVLDCKKKEIRTINLETIESLTVSGRTYTVVK